VTVPPCQGNVSKCGTNPGVAARTAEDGPAQYGHRLKGKYTCAYGNATCRNGGMDNSGKIV
jgi:hypothetical protein